jgi:hypothetical protein
METALLIAALSLCGSAQARPQWIPVGGPEKGHKLDFNSVRGAGTTRNATVSLQKTDFTTAMAVIFYVDCGRWWFSLNMYLTEGVETRDWQPIPANTLAEEVGDLICPR